MKKYNILKSILLLPVALTTYGAEIKLDAASAVGGELIEVDGRKGVRLGKTAVPRQDFILIDFPQKLEKGYWILDFELFGDFYAGTNPNVIFEFNSAGKLAFNGYFIPVRSGVFRYRLGMIADSPISQLKMFLDIRRNLPGIGMLSLAVTPATMDELQSLPLLLELRVKDGKAAMPEQLPYGVYQFELPKEGGVTWFLADGKKIETPPCGSLVRVAAGNFTGLELHDDYNGIIRAERYLDRVPLADKKLTSAPGFDLERRMSGKLELIGADGKPEMAVFPERKKIAFITSWDDGMKFDHQLTDILKKYHIAGTLAMNRNSAVIDQVKELEEKGFEIASHSATHLFMYLARPERCLTEGAVMREELEKRLGHPVISMVYPFDYRPAYDLHGEYVARTQQQAGFLAARATASDQNKRIQTLGDPLIFKPDFHFLSSPGVMAERLEKARKESPGSIIYLWGHSYELQGGGDEKLEKVLEIFSGQPDIWYATQGAFALWFLQWRHHRIDAVSAGVWELSIPWIDPALRSWAPLTLELPPGTRKAYWNGREIKMIDGQIVLDFVE